MTGSDPVIRMFFKTAAEQGLGRREILFGGVQHDQLFEALGRIGVHDEQAPVSIPGPGQVLHAPVDLGLQQQDARIPGRLHEELVERRAGGVDLACLQVESGDACAGEKALGALRLQVDELLVRCPSSVKSVGPLVQLAEGEA